MINGIFVLHFRCRFITPANICRVVSLATVPAFFAECWAFRPADSRGRVPSVACPAAVGAGLVLWGAVSLGGLGCVGAVPLCWLLQLAIAAVYRFDFVRAGGAHRRASSLASTKISVWSTVLFLIGSVMRACLMSTSASPIHSRSATCLSE